MSSEPINADVTFIERQKFRQWWLWLALFPLSLFLIGLFAHVMFKQFLLGTPIGEKPLSDIVMLVLGVITIFVALGLIFVVYKATLSVVVDGEGIHIHFFPIIRRQLLRYEDLVSCRECELPSVRARGGGGFTMDGGRRILTVGGFSGVELLLLDDDILVLSSQYPSAMVDAIQTGLAAHHARCVEPFEPPLPIP